MILYLLFFVIVASSPDLLIYGLTSNTIFIENSRRECTYNDSSCSQEICNLLNNTDLKVAYVAIKPYYLKCTILPSLYKTNMIIISLNKSFMFSKSKICYTIGDCVMSLCDLFIGNEDLFVSGYCYK